MSEALAILDCGHAPSEHSSVSTGYGTTNDGKKLCYDCITALEVEELKTGDTFVAYVSGDGQRITNWPGRELMKVSKSRKVSGGGFHFGSMLYVRAKDMHGAEWYGRGAGAGMVIRLRRSKAKRKR